MRFLDTFFSIKNDGIEKTIRILGIKIKIKNTYKSLIFELRNIEKTQQEFNIGILKSLKRLNKIESDGITIFNEMRKEKDAIVSLSAKVNAIEKNWNQTSANIDNKLTMLFDNDIFYNLDVERKVVENFYEYYENNFNLDVYKNLISNLPSEDVELIDKIIIRQQKIKNTYGVPLNLFTNKEKEELRTLKENLSDRILKIQENVYKWKDYYLPLNWFEPCVFYYKHGIDYVENLDKIKCKNIIDAGGFIGDSALVLSKYTDKKIYSFEPTPNSQKYFKQTMELNNLTNVILEPYALGDEKKEVEFNINTSSSSVCKFKHADIKEKIKVNMITLDEYVNANNIEVGLIKTDLEGAETLFLKGAKDTICAQKPTLLISIYHNPKDFFEIKPLIESWDLGYKFRVMRGVDGAVSLETMLIASVK